jgi:putative ABC transport system permease protein
MGWLRLALKYILYHRLKSLLLLACVFLTAFLPIAIEILLNSFEKEIVARSQATPIVVGPKGSRFDLTLRSLYFRVANSEESDAESIPMREALDVQRTGWAQAIPVYSKFTSKDFPVVGTNVEYLKFRGLKVASGHPLVQIGDCVLGAGVANELGLKPGDRLLTDMENVISIAAYPLNMYVRGVLAPTGSADDFAVFVDLKTAWIIDGIGHGHRNIEEVDDDKLLSRKEDGIVASAAVLPYTEINEKNIASFHFHGDESKFPISFFVAVPKDNKSQTLLIGRYRNAATGGQLVQPAKVINELMSLVFQVKRFFDANAILIAISTVLLLSLIVVLSLKIREGEMQTMFKVGASRGTILKLQLAELGLIFLAAAILVVAAAFALRGVAGDIVSAMLLGN